MSIGGGSRVLQDEARKDALRRDPEYVSYVERLRSGGYFGSEVPESNLWKTLENKAAAAYVDSRKEEYVVLSSVPGLDLTSCSVM
jgi:hypothetical protein